jgi:hypothetical protein
MMKLLTLIMRPMKPRFKQIINNHLIERVTLYRMRSASLLTKRKPRLNKSIILATKKNHQAQERINFINHNRIKHKHKKMFVHPLAKNKNQLKL